MWIMRWKLIAKDSQIYCGQTDFSNTSLAQLTNMTTPLTLIITRQSDQLLEARSFGTIPE